MPLLSTVKDPHVSVLPAVGRALHSKALAPGPPGTVLQQYWELVMHVFPTSVQHSVSMGPTPQEEHSGLHAVLASELEKEQQISCVLSVPVGHTSGGLLLL